MAEPADAVAMDLGAADVHAPSAIGQTKARLARIRSRKGKNAAPSDDARKRPPRSIHVRADLAPGGVLHVRHMTFSDDGAKRLDAYEDGTFRLRDVRPIVQGEKVDPVEAGIALKGPASWKDGTPKKLVWVQLAEVGAWKGHGAGPFEISPATFSEIVSNFERRKLPIAADMEHASEADATSGSIPVTGAPAHGWAHKLENRGVGGLWGLVEWFDYARDGINSGAFAYLSPAIRFGSKDPVTGASVGARLTSFAITNSPFLTGLDGLRAATDKVTPAAPFAVTLASKDAMTRPVHQPHEYMPRIKSALGLTSLHTAMDCSDHLDRLRDACMSAGGAGMYQGTNLGDHVQPLRDLVGAQPGMTLEELLDTVEDLIANAMEQHVAEMHPGATVANSDEGTDTTMSDQASAILLKDAQTKLKDVETQVSTLTLQLRDVTTERDTAATKLKDVEAKATAAEERAKTAEATVTLKDTEIAQKELELVALRADKAKRDAADLENEVEAAFLTYKDKKGLKEADKAHLKVLASGNLASFRHMYPPVQVDQRHLLRTLVTTEPGRGEADGPVTLHDATEKIMRETGLPFAEAQIRAMNGG